MPSGTRPRRPAAQNARLSVIPASSQQVVHGWLGPELFLEPDRIALPEEPRDLALRVGEVTEVDGMTGTRLGARGPAAGVTVVLAVLVLEMEAERALPDVAHGRAVGRPDPVLLVLGRDRVAGRGKHLVVVAEVERASAVRAGRDAVPAADAAVVVDDDNAVRRPP